MNSSRSTTLPSANSQRDHSLQRRRILCVDDDPNISAAIARRLRPLSIDVLAAYSGMQGYWQLVTKSPDAVIVDLAMPNGSGTEMIECVMRNHVIRHTPILVLTGSSDPACRRRLSQLGISGFLRKPVACEILLRELASLIDLGDLALPDGCRETCCASAALDLLPIE